MHPQDNDSPRQPVWQRPAPPAPVTTTADTRRCLCGARPTPAGVLPCDH